MTIKQEIVRDVRSKFCPYTRETCSAQNCHAFAFRQYKCKKKLIYAVCWAIGSPHQLSKTYTGEMTHEYGFLDSDKPIYDQRSHSK